MALVVLIVLLVLFFINVPIAFSIGFATVIATFFSKMPFPLIRLPETMFSSLNSFPILAVPFFILAGSLMEYGGISQKLIDFANSLVGHLKGGLCFVTILTCMFFGAISGSAMACTAAVGLIMIPSMVKHRYDKKFSAALQAAAGTTGAMIPPSVPAVLYGLSGGVSIGKLFLAGVFPGILVGVSLMVVTYFISAKHGYGDLDRKFSLKDVLLSFKNAIWALLMPVIILGGIYSGFFTPTEAATVASVYGFAVGKFIYKKIDLGNFKKILRSTILTTSSIGLILATASFFGRWMTLERVPQNLATIVTNAHLSPISTILIINVFLLILGMFMDTGAAMIILPSILLPIVTPLGFDPIHFGVIMIVNTCIGLLTPPLGLSLFVAARVGKIEYTSLVKPIVPMILIMIADLMIITFVPQISVGFANLIMP